MPNNKLLLTIAGLSILINTSEDEGYTRELAAELDNDINTILSANTGASVTNAALLCAIDYLDSAKKSAKNANSMRNQIKEYMDDAAKTKFKFDEEHKRANELAIEIQSLRSHLTRLATEGDSSGVVQNIKSELTTTKQDLQDMRDKAGKIAAANKALNEKSAAMSDYIAGQDKEIARLGSIVTELNKTIAKKDEQLAALAARIESLNSENRSVKSENARLNTELYALEQSMNEDRVKSRELSSQLAALRLEIEAARNGSVPPQEAAQDSARAGDDASLPEQLPDAAASPIVFDYDAPFDAQDAQPSIGFEKQEQEEADGTMDQLRFEDTVSDENSEAPGDSPVIFENFKVSDNFPAEQQEEKAVDKFKVIQDESDGLPDLSWTLEV